MLYYTNHPLNFVRSATQIGHPSFSRCPYCKEELPNCDCGYGSDVVQKRPAKPRALRRRVGRKRLF